MCSNAILSVLNKLATRLHRFMLYNPALAGLDTTTEAAQDTAHAEPSTTIISKIEIKIKATFMNLLRCQSGLSILKKVIDYCGSDPQVQMILNGTLSSLLPVSKQSVHVLDNSPQLKY